MKLTPYKKLLAMTKEAVDATLAPIRAKSARKQAELEMAKLEETIATLETEVTQLASVREVNFGRMIDKLDDLALAERKRGQFQKILEEMFPEE